MWERDVITHQGHTAKEKINSVLKEGLILGIDFLAKMRLGLDLISLICLKIFFFHALPRASTFPKNWLNVIFHKLAKCSSPWKQTSRSLWNYIKYTKSLSEALVLIKWVTVEVRQFTLLFQNNYYLGLVDNLPIVLLHRHLCRKIK